jgi:hypothetical protein
MKLPGAVVKVTSERFGIQSYPFERGVSREFSHPERVHEIYTCYPELRPDALFWPVPKATKVNTSSNATKVHP